jgi:hypothetical protein
MVVLGSFLASSRGKLLSKKDEKAHAMILHLYAYPNSQPAEFEVVCYSLFVFCSAKWWFQSDDEEMLPLKSMVQKVPSMPKSCKRKCK